MKWKFSDILWNQRGLCLVFHSWSSWVKVIQPVRKDQIKTAPKQTHWDLTASVQTGKQMFNRMSGEQGPLILIVRKCLVEVQCGDHVQVLSEGSHPHPHDLQRVGSKQVPVPPWAKLPHDPAPASFRRVKPVTTRRSSLKACESQWSWSTGVFKLLIVPHLQSNVLTAWIRAAMLCAVVESAWVSAWELTLAAMLDFSCSEVILTQLSVNSPSTVWKLPENALHRSVPMDKTCTWSGIGFLP